jgi:hypothetical protein
VNDFKPWNNEYKYHHFYCLASLSTGKLERFTCRAQLGLYFPVIYILKNVLQQLQMWLMMQEMGKSQTHLWQVNELKFDSIRNRKYYFSIASLST